MTPAWKICLQNLKPLFGRVRLNKRLQVDFILLQLHCCFPDLKTTFLVKMRVFQNPIYFHHLRIYLWWAQYRNCCTGRDFEHKFHFSELLKLLLQQYFLTVQVHWTRLQLLQRLKGKEKIWISEKIFAFRDLEQNTKTKSVEKIWLFIHINDHNWKTLCHGIRILIFLSELDFYTMEMSLFCSIHFCNLSITA